MSKKQKILLLSAYDANSHQKWRKTLTQTLNTFDWTTLTLPPRYFGYRIRTSALTWHQQNASELREHYDLILATSLSDVCGIKALFSNLAGIPVWLYCHENQFSYPRSQLQKTEHIIDAQTSFIMNCASADWISFNSHWNRSSALSGMRDLIRRWPERLSSSLVEHIEKKSEVLPVPVSTGGSYSKERECPRTLSITWNHRWEYDKGPEYLSAFVQNLHQLLKQSACERVIRLNIVGQQFRKNPTEIDLAVRKAKMLEERNSNFSVGAVGFIPQEETYQRLLQTTDIVLSTATHDFQGLAILEAVNAGATPLVPDRLAYTEIFNPEYLYKWEEQPEACAENIVGKLKLWIANELPESPVIDGLSKEALLPLYAAKIVELLDSTDYHENH